MGWLVLLLGLFLVLPSHGSYQPDNERPEDVEKYIEGLLQQYERNKLLRQRLFQESKDPEFITYDKQNNEKRKEEVNYAQVKDDNLLNEINLAAEEEEDVREEDTEKSSTDQTPTTPDSPSDTGTKNVGEKKSGDAEAPMAPLHQKSPLSNTQAYSQPDLVFILIVAGCSIAGLVGLIMAGVCWYKLHSNVKAAGDVEYPAYGVTGPTKDRLPSPGDRKLAQSAQMYHYQHQKQQMIALEKANNGMKPEASDEESEEENEEGDYTVYECPGLAPTGEMEVRNPLFNEDVQTPVGGQAPVVNGHPENQGKQ